MDEAQWETWKALTYPTKRTCENCLHSIEYEIPSVSQYSSKHYCTLHAGMMCDVYNTHWVSNKRPYISWTDQQKHMVPVKKLWEWNGK